jgi:hypothetical protein
MGDIKPLGSEKLQGSDKMKRILELTYYHENKNNPKSTTKSELVKESTNGVYGIIKERDGYYVKKGLTESTLDYIGGMFMKNKNRFNSYAEALKRLELLSSQEIQEEATKYVLKQNTQKTEAPKPAPTFPEPASSAPAPAPAPAPSAAPEDMGGAPEDMGGMPEDMDAAPEDMGGEEPTDAPEGGDGGPEHMKEVQRLSGKLGQAIREIEDEMESDDVKYVINMILSAVDIEKLSEEDKEAIIDRFEPEESFDDAYTPEEPESGEDAGAEPSAEDEPTDELAETMKKLEELINTKIGGKKTPEKAIESEIDEYFFFDDEESSNEMPNEMPGEESSRSGFHTSKQVERPSRFAKSMKTGIGWLDDKGKHHKEDDFNMDDYDEEDFDDYESFSAKHGDTSLDIRDKKYFNHYKPMKIKTLRKYDQTDITPELGDINEAINTTLSKYFE